LKLQDGHTLIELLIVTAIISVLAAAALPQFYPFKTRAYDADAKANLHNVFLSCKGYWTFTSSINPCVLGTVSGNEYGFVQSAAVEVTIENASNTETDFVASASHIWSSNVYVIDYRGAITSTSGGGGKSSKDDKSTAKEKKKKK
jgi:type IV pilus assembly protein PilA